MSIATNKIDRRAFALILLCATTTTTQQTQPEMSYLDSELGQRPYPTTVDEPLVAVSRLILRPSILD